jgi:hypothetical protein
VGLISEAGQLLVQLPFDPQDPAQVRPSLDLFALSEQLWLRLMRCVCGGLLVQRMNGFISALCFSKTSRYLCTAGEDLDIMVTLALRSLDQDLRTPTSVLIGDVRRVFDRLMRWFSMAALALEAQRADREACRHDELGLELAVLPHRGPAFVGGFGWPRGDLERARRKAGARASAPQCAEAVGT